MKRLTTTAGALLVLGTLAVGGLTAASASPKPMPLGSPAHLTLNGTPFTLTVESVQNPAQLAPGESPPGAGLRDIALKIKVVDTGKSVITFNLDNLMAVLDNKGAQYQPDFDLLANCPAFYGGSIVNIGPGASVSGCIPVGIPVGSQPWRVIVVGSTSILAEWSVGSTTSRSPLPPTATDLASAEAHVATLLQAYKPTPSWKAQFQAAIVAQQRDLAAFEKATGA
jgi:hypothetical protein